MARWAARLGGPAADVEDLVHEVFLVVERKLDGLRSADALSTWLYRITANVVRHQRRKNRLRRFLVGDELESVPAVGDPEQDAAKAERVRLVYRALDRLSEKYRTVLILHALEGLSGPEISVLIGVPVKTVWVRLHRARKKFAAAVEQIG